MWEFTPEQPFLNWFYRLIPCVKILVSGIIEYRNNQKNVFSRIREMADEVNQAELSQFMFTFYLILSNFSCMGMIDHKSWVECNGFIVKLGEKHVFSHVKMVKMHRIFLALYLL